MTPRNTSFRISACSISFISVLWSKYLRIHRFTLCPWTKCLLLGLLDAVKILIQETITNHLDQAEWSDS